MSISVLNARIVPFSMADAGMTLNASPAEICVTDITPDSRGEMVRDTMDWRLTTREDAATMGSMVRCGMAAWPPIPWRTMVNISAAAMRGPGLDAMTPEGRLIYYVMNDDENGLTMEVLHWYRLYIRSV